jgi:hypothetical protein
MQDMNRAMEKVAAELSSLSGGRLTLAVKRKAYLLMALLCFIRNDLHMKTRLGLPHALRSWRRGFQRFNYKLYGLDNGGDPARYISDFTALLIHRTINGQFGEFMRNKYAFGLLLELMGMPTPRIQALIIKGEIYPRLAAKTVQAGDFLRDAAAAGEPLVLKPLSGYHGFGFIGLIPDGAGLRMNGEAVSREQAARMIASLDNYIVSEFVTQGEFCSRFYPRTTNTIRLFTLRDAEKGEPFLARAVMRIGSARSFPVDNFKGGRGGLSALIDPRTGKLGPGAAADATGKPVWHTHHPESHAPIEGVVIPGWESIRAAFLDYARRLAFMPCIGWDITLTDGGFSILEGNSTPGMPVMQVHGPLLDDPRIRRFYEEARAR